MILKDIQKVSKITFKYKFFGVSNRIFKFFAKDFLSDSHSRLSMSISLNQKDHPTIGRYFVADLIRLLEPF